MSVEHSREKTQELLKFYFNLAVEGGLDGDNRAEIDEICDYIFNSIQKVEENLKEKIIKEITPKIKEEVIKDIIKALEKS